MIFQEFYQQKLTSTNWYTWDLEFSYLGTFVKSLNELLCLQMCKLLPDTCCHLLLLHPNVKAENCAVVLKLL